MNKMRFLITGLLAFSTQAWSGEAGPSEAFRLYSRFTKLNQFFRAAAVLGAEGDGKVWLALNKEFAKNSAPKVARRGAEIVLSEGKRELRITLPATPLAPVKVNGVEFVWNRSFPIEAHVSTIEKILADTPAKKSKATAFYLSLISEAMAQGTAPGTRDPLAAAGAAALTLETGAPPSAAIVAQLQRQVADMALEIEQMRAELARTRNSSASVGTAGYCQNAYDAMAREILFTLRDDLTNLVCSRDNTLQLRSGRTYSGRPSYSDNGTRLWRATFPSVVIADIDGRYGIEVVNMNLCESFESSTRQLCYNTGLADLRIPVNALSSREQLTTALNAFISRARTRLDSVQSRTAANSLIDTQIEPKKNQIVDLLMGLVTVDPYRLCNDCALQNPAQSLREAITRVRGEGSTDPARAEQAR